MDGCHFKRDNRLLAAMCLYALIFTAPGCGKPETISSGNRSPRLEFDPGLAIPSARELRIPTNSSDFYKLDFMALGDCDLQITLGKYQSSLGRNASDSQRLLLDLEYLRLAPQCIKLKRVLGETALVEFLVGAEKHKRDQLAAGIFNATLASTEFQHFWGKPAANDIQSRQRPQALPALQAINALAARWLAGDYRAINIEFEIHLNEITRGGIPHRANYSRELHQHIVQLEQHLAATLPPRYSTWMEQRRLYFARLEPAL